MASGHPERVAHYRVLRKLGEGGMGVVYAAHDERLGRSVAIKMIRSGTDDEESRLRLWREARSAASVNHPNVCQLYEIGEAEGELYIAMELLEGESLAERLARGPLDPGDAAQITLSVLSALEPLHRHGLLHRDLKPSNVFLNAHGVKLLDFGLARSTIADDATQALTQTGLLVGTPAYMAPEQLRDAALDPRTDLFAVGAMLYEMLTGVKAFRGATLIEICNAVLSAEPPALAGSAAVTALDRVIHRALAKQPEDRYATAEAMAAAIREALSRSESGAAQPAARPRTRLIVLPFRILRPDPETDFLAFSLPDAVTGTLAGLESMVVRSTPTAMQLARETEDIGEIARRAEVDLLLTGSVLRGGERIRVSTQLVDARSGTLLWSDTAETTLGDAFQLQDALTRRIVGSLEVPLSAQEQRLLGQHVPASARAYEYYLRANQLANDPKQWEIARDLYRRCLDADPGFAPAWARLGRIHRLLALRSGDTTGYEQAQEAFRRALEIDPELPVAHNLYTPLELDLDRAREAMVRLIERAKSHAGDPELFAGLVQACRYCGLNEVAVAAYEHARRLDPAIRTAVTHAYFMLGESERAIATDHDDPPYVTLLALEQMGRAGEAVDRLRSFLARPLAGTDRRFLDATLATLEGRAEDLEATVGSLLGMLGLRDPCGSFYLARSFSRLGCREPAVRYLRAAVEGGFYPFAFMTRDPWLDPLRVDAEFRDVLERAEARHREARAAFLAAGGDRLLAVSRV